MNLQPPPEQYAWPSRVNVVLLVVYPIAWFAPLATAGMFPWLFKGNEISILGGIYDLMEADIALAILVAIFAVVIPYAKTIALAAVHFGRMGREHLPLIEIIGKLSMADVFLIALYIVIVKGVGVGSVATSWGLWLFTGCVLASFWVGWTTAKAMRDAPEP
ncbi:MAG: paraquat-inducible protein A [Pseudomonadota bacterium]